MFFLFLIYCCSWNWTPEGGGRSKAKYHIKYRTTPEKTSKTTLNFPISNILFIAPSINFKWRTYRGEGGGIVPTPLRYIHFIEKKKFYKWHFM